MNKNLHVLLVAAACCCFTARHSAFAQGNLTPPGPPAPTMKTLDQIEPGIPISSLPFTITNGGSYFLTGNLTGVASANGISINADNVTLDLRGFALIGASNAFNGVAIGDLFNSRQNVAVRNGTVRGWPGGDGVLGRYSSNLQLEQLRVSQNGGAGISAGLGSLIVNCVAGTNASGFFAREGSTVKDCTAWNNTGDGLYVNGGASVIDCTIYQNGGRGIVAGSSGFSLDGCSVIGCTVKGNVGVGISAGQGCTLKDCTAHSNTGGGIVAGDGSRIIDCTVLLNSSMGILVGSGASVQGCTVKTNIGSGIEGNDQCLVADCVSFLNSFYGIRLRTGATVRNCSVAGNHAEGISVDNGSTVKDCSVRSNSYHGIVTGFACTVDGCTASANGSTGIASAYSTISDCTTSTNGGSGIEAGKNGTVIGCTATANAYDGIDASGNCQVLNNCCAGNGGSFPSTAGISYESDNNRIEGNQLGGNKPYGIFNASSGVHTVVIRNTAYSDAVQLTNYATRGGDDVGPIGSAASATSPWANISH